MSKVRIGFIGAGRIADLHALAYADNPRAELVAVADTTPGRAELRARQWGAQRHHDDYRELLADDTIDGVEILLPHHLHAGVAMDALRAGKAVSLQKPPGISLAQADALFEVAAKAAPLFRVFDNFLCYAPFRLAKSIVEAGDIGEPLMFKVSAVYGRGVGGWTIPAEAGAWRADPKSSGGPSVIIDHGAHMAATADYFMGPVERLHTFMLDQSAQDACRPPMTITMCFAGGRALGVWTMTGADELAIPTRYYPGDEFVEITGSAGILWVNRCSGELLDAPPVALLRGGRMRHFEDVETDWAESFRTGGQEFADAIETGGQPDMGITMARRVYASQLAAVRSAAEAREVTVAEID